MVLLGTVSADNVDKTDKQAKKDIHFENSLVYGSQFAAEELPHFEMRDEPMPAETAYQLVHDELQGDGSTSLNLASFVTTYMEPHAEKLMTESMTKNMIDAEEYPATQDISNRCVNMIARLFNAPVNNADDESLGVSTVGSSEAIILATLAMKRKWQKARKAAGKPYDKPNIVMNSAVQVCWEKAARYLDIVEKYVYCTKDRYVIDPKEAVELCDENTVGVVGILGTTYTGEYEDIKALNDGLEKLQAEKGLDIKIHVDAASGGFVAPFVKPDLQWDFRLPRVVSINASGHKYGMTYAGVGWAVWRSKEYLPEELIFHVNYLGAEQASFTLNFSKSASQVIGQYYVLIRNGKSGFRAIMQSITETSDWLAAELESTGRFVRMNPGGGESLPLVAFRLKEKHHYDEFAIAARLRSRNWIVPAYTMAPHADGLKLLRIVCRLDFSRSRAAALVRDIEQVCDFLDTQDKETIAAWFKDHQTAKQTHAKNRKGTKMNDKHSLQGKHGKTHAVC
ncbi:hypothetical protein QFC20_002424 [Naganishia adeliensis]|uniref:Uncharacterized protein n=1 Tax=Naganishia adeliensis TaxID=92952 RepID=A0ACC2WL84_9TREE|nr:hypothetical protein QFC20_002424 [Naganishia adeliensis]